MRRNLFKITVHTLALILWALPLFSLYANSAVLQDGNLPHHPTTQVMADCSSHHSGDCNHALNQSQPGEACSSGTCDLCCNAQIVKAGETVLGTDTDHPHYSPLHQELLPEPALFPFLRPPERIA